MESMLVLEGSTSGPGLVNLERIYVDMSPFSV